MTTTVASSGAAAAHTAQETASPLSRMGNPAAWAILAFSTTSFMLGLYNAGLVNPAGSALVIPVAFVFGGAIQIIVAVLAIIHGNAFAATVFGSYGPFWIIYGMIETTYAPKVVAAATAAKSDPTQATASGLTVFLSMFIVLTVVFLIASLRTDAVLVAVLGLVTIALILLAVGVHSGDASLEHVSGYLTLVFAILGWYRGAADVIAATFGREVLPLGHLNKAAH